MIFDHRENRETQRFLSFCEKNFIKHWIIALLFLFLTLGLGYGVQQSDFYPMIAMYGLFFGLYVWLCQSDFSKKEIHFYIGLGIVLRVVLLFALPNLSDDVYRFIWDGRLINQGINPFEYLPSYYINDYQGETISGIDKALFEQLNSPEYFTIYPPIAQGVFALATCLFPTSIFGSSFVIKLFLLACEVGSIFLLIKLFSQNLHTTLWYVLNPLIIVEICGNLHFEGAMVFFLLLAFYLLQKKSYSLSAIAIAFSVASKLLPLMFLPLLIRPMTWKKSVQYFIVVGITTLLLFLPLLSGVFLSNFGESLDLYFRRFEFNGSLYYVLRWLGFQIKGYNLIGVIGPLLAGITFVGILLMAFQKSNNSLKKLPKNCLWAICLYLLCTTTVHPWYTALPIVLCLFTPFRFPILWSGLIFLTYINYSYGEYYANLWVVALEYSLVGLFFLWELKKCRNNFP